MIAGYHHDVPMSVYLADPCEAPSLSTTTVETLVNRTPIHAHATHPRFGGRVEDFSARADIGSAVHSVIHGGCALAVGDWDDWRTKDSKTFRDESRAAGVIPLLRKDEAVVVRAAERGIEALKAYGGGNSAQHEVTMIWQLDNGVWCRGRADFLGEHPQLGLVDIDTKTCDDADPFSWPGRNVKPHALDVQHVLRRIGHKVLSGQTRTHLWMLVEIEVPFAVSFVAVDDTMIANATRKINHAADTWERCLRTNEWPGYSDAPVWASANTYAELELDARGVKP